MQPNDLRRLTHQLPLLRVVCLLCACTLLLSGCEMLGLSDSDTANKSPKKKSKKKGDKDKPVAKDVPQAKEKEEYQRPEYPDKIRRNPFLPDMEVVKPKKQVVEGQIRPLEPLEQYALGSLELAAIISEVAVPKAMFVDPEGFGHVIKEGDRIGRNGGVISDIRDNEVEVREVTDEADSQTRLTTIKLRERQLDTDDQAGLSERERDALKKLLQSDEGKQALREAMQQKAAAGTASEGSSPPPGDGRFSFGSEGTSPP